MKRLTKRFENGRAILKVKAYDGDAIAKAREKATQRLAELEDKLESGQLLELPCVREVKDYKGIKYQICFIRDNTYNIGSIDYYETRDKAQAEARLKELQEKL